MYDVIKVNAYVSFMTSRILGHVRYPATVAVSATCVTFHLYDVMYDIQVRIMRIYDVIKVKYIFRCHSAVYPALLQP